MHRDTPQKRLEKYDKGVQPSDSLDRSLIEHPWNETDLTPKSAHVKMLLVDAGGFNPVADLSHVASMDRICRCSILLGSRQLWGQVGWVHFPAGWGAH